MVIRFWRRFSTRTCALAGHRQCDLDVGGVQAGRGSCFWQQVGSFCCSLRDKGGCRARGRACRAWVSSDGLYATNYRNVGVKGSFAAKLQAAVLEGSRVVLGGPLPQCSRGEIMLWSAGVDVGVLLVRVGFCKEPREKLDSR